jgi:hypothetical protein
MDDLAARELVSGAASGAEVWCARLRSRKYAGGVEATRLAVEGIWLWQSLEEETGLGC